LIDPPVTPLRGEEATRPPLIIIPSFSLPCFPAQKIAKSTVTEQWLKRNATIDNSTSTHHDAAGM
jgi:hypothetical protein